MSMEGENAIHVEGVGRDEPFAPRVAPVLLQPLDVFVAGNKGVFAVDALPGPVGHPVGRVAEELGCTECVGKQDEQLALVGLLP